MKKFFAIIIALAVGVPAFSQQQKIPVNYKWVSSKEVVFSYDGTYTDLNAFSVNPVNGKILRGVKSPEKFTSFPLSPDGAVNLTYSPDSTKLAFTRNNDLYVVDIASGKESRLTFDGTDLILNGYASWVYYEEIFGRPSKYRAFWWSPDSRKIGFYRFDNSEVPMFPIFSAKGQDGSLRQTRYPKCGENNPKVRIGIVDLDTEAVTWAAFDENEDQYFGTPFWGADSRKFFVSREPRTQNTLDLYAVSAEDGTLSHIYHETYKTWLDWIDGMLFGKDGLYMVRSFETLWQQIYYLSYDGKVFRRLTDGKNWRISLVDVDEKKGEVYFTAHRDATVRRTFYKVDSKGVISALTDPAYHALGIQLSPDKKHFVAVTSNFSTPNQIRVYNTANPRKNIKVADQAAEGFDISKCIVPSLVSITTSDGLVLPGMIVYPKNFDPSKKYPVHVDIYGGPDHPMVIDSWKGNARYRWYWENGIIELTADCRAAGHNGREGLDRIYRQLSEIEVSDFCEWASWLQGLPYVKGNKIGVEGFSFGGTMTSLLVMDHPDKFHYGIAGGGVYDWSLYDTHYTERFMDTPQNNPEGYEKTRVIGHVGNYVADVDKDNSDVMLKLTHGTGDDNVHFQNTLQLVDALQKAGKEFEFMIYPDGMHGYRDEQGRHFQAENRKFWLKYLKN